MHDQKINPNIYIALYDHSTRIQHSFHRAMAGIMFKTYPSQLLMSLRCRFMLADWNPMPLRSDLGFSNLQLRFGALLLDQDII